MDDVLRQLEEDVALGWVEELQDEGATPVAGRR
jgi:hypothetical protein